VRTFSAPLVSWNAAPVQGVMLFITPDALQQMTGFDPTRHLNRLTDVHEILPPDWCDFCEDVLADPDDLSRVRRIEDFLEPRWAAVRQGPALAHRYHDWTQGLALRAAQSTAGLSLRQLERRVKLWAGQPLLELHGVGKLERAFFDTFAAEEKGSPNIAAIAVDNGYTGILGEEPFWPYRAWMA
jgi:hypothetical protein